MKELPDGARIGASAVTKMDEKLSEFLKEQTLAAWKLASYAEWKTLQNIDIE